MLVYCQIHSSPFRRRLQQWTPFCFHPVVRETNRNDLEKVTRLVSSFFPTHSHTHTTHSLHTISSRFAISFAFLFGATALQHSVCCYVMRNFTLPQQKQHTQIHAYIRFFGLPRISNLRHCRLFGGGDVPVLPPSVQEPKNPPNFKPIHIAK